MKLSRLIAELNPREVTGDTSVDVKGVASDSRLVAPGYIFIAIPGRKKNGKDYIIQARDRGAVGIVFSELSGPIEGALAQIKVDNPRRALGILSNAVFGYPARALKMIGVVGTNGKTTVTHLSRSILEEAELSTGLIGTNYYGIGPRRLPAGLTTPAPPRLQELLSEMRKAGCTRVIIEVSSHAIDQFRMEGIDFQTAVFTNLSQDHLDYHGSMAKYREVKSSFFNNFSQKIAGKTLVINNDDLLSGRILSMIQAPVITYGLNSAADLFASNLILERGGSSFMLHWKGTTHPVKISLPGRHNIYNALAAIGIGLTEKIKLKEILNSIGRSRGIRGRLEQVDTGRNFDLFIDYAHTPDGLKNVLNTLRELNYRRIIVVFGCGGDRDQTKRPLMGAAAARGADVVIVTTDNPRSEDPEMIIKDITAGIHAGEKKLKSIVDRREAIEYACKQAGAGDVVLIAGKGHEQIQIFHDVILPFSDRKTAESILSVIK